MAVSTIAIIALCVWSLKTYAPLIPGGSMWVLFATAVFVAFFPVTISNLGISFSAVLPVAIAALYLFSPLAAVCIQAAAITVQATWINRGLMRSDVAHFARRLAGECSRNVIALGVPALVFASLCSSNHILRHSLGCGVALSLVYLAAFYLQACLDTTFAARKHAVRWDVVWYQHYRWTLLGAVLIAPLGFVTGALAEQSMACAILFLLLPLAAAQRGYQLHVRKLAVYRQGVDLLGRLMQEAHPYTHGHLHRVAAWARRIAEKVGLPPSSMALIEDAAILHDIGKIAIDDRILNKLGRLEEPEWSAIKRHPDTGADVVAQIRYLEKVSHWVRHHHERIDGLGYPSGLAGASIPLESRIIAVVDAFDAMVGGPSKEDTRPYRKPLTYEEARAELRRCAGSQFDAVVVRSFLAILDEEKRPARKRTTEGSA